MDIFEKLIASGSVRRRRLTREKLRQVIHSQYSFSEYIIHDSDINPDAGGPTDQLYKSSIQEVPQTIESLTLYSSLDEERNQVRPSEPAPSEMKSKSAPRSTQTTLPSHVKEMMDFVGDYPDVPSEAVRIGFLNVDTLTYDTRSQETSLGLQQLTALDFDLLCLQEVNKDLRDFELKGVWQRFSRRFKAFCYSYTPPPQAADRNSPGGLLTLSRVKSMESKKVFQDKYGRWQKIAISLGREKVKIYNLYFPHKHSNGPPTVYNQLRNSMCAVEDYREPEFAFLEDFKTALSQDIRQNEKIIIGGDFNSDMANTRWGKTLSKLKLIHVNSERNLAHVPTHIRGKVPLDHIWVSPNVKSSITGFGFSLLTTVWILIIVSCT